MRIHTHVLTKKNFNVPRSSLSGNWLRLNWVELIWSKILAFWSIRICISSNVTFHVISHLSSLPTLMKFQIFILYHFAASANCVFILWRALSWRRWMSGENAEGGKRKAGLEMDGRYEAGPGLITAPLSYLCSPRLLCDQGISIQSNNLQQVRSNKDASEVRD